MRKVCSIIAVATAVGLAPFASAALMLTLQSGAETVVIPGVAGAVTYTGNIGGFSGTYTFGLSNSPGTSFRGLLQVSSISVHNTGNTTSSLKITLSDTDFTAPGNPGDTLTLQSAIGGTLALGILGDTVQFQSWADASNAPLAALSTGGPQLFTSPGGPLASYNDTVFSKFVRAGAAYSLTNVTTVTLNPGTEANISGTTSTLVPEPATASMALLSVGGLLARRRKA
jgi:hypothetical protein